MSVLSRKPYKHGIFADKTTVYIHLIKCKMISRLAPEQKYFIAIIFNFATKNKIKL